MYGDADEGVVNRAELLDGLVRSGEKTLDTIARAAEFLQGPLQLDRGLLGVGPSQVVGERAIIPGPEDAYFGAGHVFSFNGRISGK